MKKRRTEVADAEKGYLESHGCKLCGSKETQILMVRYTQPLVYEYHCDGCGHDGSIVQSNWQMPRIDLTVEKYFEAKQIAASVKCDIYEVVESLGGTVDFGPESEFTQT